MFALAKKKLERYKDQKEKWGDRNLLPPSHTNVDWVHRSAGFKAVASTRNSGNLFFMLSRFCIIISPKKILLFAHYWRRSRGWERNQNLCLQERKNCVGLSFGWLSSSLTNTMKFNQKKTSSTLLYQTSSLSTHKNIIFFFF